jgi:hypothetical protein
MIRDTPTLAANYLLKRLEAIGCQAVYPERRPATNSSSPLPNKRRTTT